MSYVKFSDNNFLHFFDFFNDFLFVFLLFRFIDHPDFKTIITVEGISEYKVHAAVNSLLTALPPNAVLR